jgi:aldose 1-epimerase
MKAFNNLFLGTVIAGAMLSSCGGDNKASGELKSGLKVMDFKTVYKNDLKGEKEVSLYTLTNKNGMEVDITNFGGRIVSIMVPDKDGNFQDVVLGFDTAEKYFPQNHQTDYGSAIGRYANRIDQGKINVDGEEIQLPQNNFGHCLHGGPDGWQYQVYDAKQIDDQTLELTMDSPDGDNNFPGNLKATVTYKLTEDNAIEISYKATTDKKTVINMTNHSYFNLSGDPNNTIADELITVDADYYTPTDTTYMTTGEVKSVEGTAFDLRKECKLGANFGDKDPEIKAAGGGFDHNWCLNTKGDKSKAAVKLYDPRSGIVLQVYTNEPGIQVYTGNFQDGSCTGKKGIVYNKQCAVCLETQKYPDSPNKYQMEGWEDSNCWLNPGETYESYCKFAFSVQK